MPLFKLILVMAIWGSVGIFSRHIPLDPVLIAFSRPTVALPLLWMLFRRETGDSSRVSRNFILWRPYILSGALMGLAWWSLLAAFDRIGVAVAILAYNMCPVYVMALAPWLLKERFRPVQMVKLLVAVCGLLLVIAKAPSLSSVTPVGLAMALLSGFFYACIVLLNRRQQGDGLPVIQGTLIQMVSAGLILLPVVLTRHPVAQLQEMGLLSWCLLILLGILHTGIAYALYFSVYKGLKARTIAYASYLEPVFGIVFGVLFLCEQMSAGQMLGGLMILGILFIRERQAD